MSLWKIPDSDTRQLMEAFYERVVGDPTGPKPVALRAAQLDAISRQRQARGHSDPRSWGAFIASGW
jgi:CHAT domain-containing protein